MPVNIARVDYRGWANSYRLTNDVIDLVVTTDVGPRIIRCGFVGQENEFKEFAAEVGKTGGDEWRSYGGHRLWHAPEVWPRSYCGDNSVVAFEAQGDLVHLSQPVEPATGIQKEIDILLAPDSADVRVTHRLRNMNLWTVELAPWAISVMAADGTAILPLPPRGPHETNLRPVASLAYWAYTDLTDPRWTIGRRFILLRQDGAARDPQKGGLAVPDGWIACARNNHLFVKRAAYVAGATYPDLGCSMETYASSEILEIETLGPLVRLEPQATVEHVEDWSLFDGVSTPRNDEDVLADILPRISAS
jgi:hypothetical protein